MIDLNGAVIWVMAKGYAPDEGGMQTYAQSVAEAYMEMGAKVTVVTQTSIGPRRVRIRGVDVHDLGPDRTPLALWKFCRMLRRLELWHRPPDLLHATTWRTAVPAMLTGLPFVVTFHGREFMRAHGIVLAVLQRVARVAQDRIAVSHFTAGRLREKTGFDATVAWNGVSSNLRLTRVRAEHDGPPLILSLCRLELRKNIRAAILAAAQCRDIGLSFRYVICGRGPEEKAIAKLIEDCGLHDHVELAGFVDQQRARQLYETADIFLHPQIAADNGQDFEGFGIAIADAMYCGQAVIVGRDGGPAELVDDGRTGFLLDGNDCGAIADALRQLLVDDGMRRRMGQAAARHARENFRWDRHVDVILEGLSR